MRERMSFDPLAIMRPDLDIDRDDAAFADELAKARRKNGRSAMRNARFNDHVGLEAEDRLLIADHIFRELNDRNAEPGKSIGVFLVPADLHPELCKRTKSIIAIKPEHLSDAPPRQRIRDIAI